MIDFDTFLGGTTSRPFFGSNGGIDVDVDVDVGIDVDACRDVGR